MTTAKKALVVLSGGQDSTTCLFWAKQHYEEIHAITFDYGQRHSIEIDAACIVGDLAGVANHEIIDIPLCLTSSSPLVSKNALEQYESYEQMMEQGRDRVEPTFVPMRNAMFFVIAANRAAALGGAVDIVTGICGEDAAGYADTTEDFRQSFNAMIREALRTRDINIVAPLMFQTKAQSVQIAAGLPGCMEALAYSHTSYDGNYPPTDMNHANVLRAKGFEDAGIPDPLVVRAVREGLMELPETANYDGIAIQMELIPV